MQWLPDMMKEVDAAELLMLPAFNRVVKVSSLSDIFDTVAAPPTGLSTKSLIEAILEERPDLCGKTVYQATSGQCGIVLFIGDEVFKGMKSPADWQTFDREWQALKALEGKGFPVPEVVTVGKHAHFFSMTRMPGVMLAEHLAGLTPDEKARIADDIALVMKGMDVYCTGDKFSKGVLYHYPKASVAALRGRAEIIRDLGGYNWNIFRQELKKHEERLQHGKEGIFHTDIHAGNVLIDPVTKRVTGVVDFGFVGYRLPEQMIRTVLSTPQMPRGFADLMCRAYEKLDDDFSAMDFHRNEMFTALFNLYHGFREVRGGEARRIFNSYLDKKAQYEVPAQPVFPARA